MPLRSPRAATAKRVARVAPRRGTRAASAFLLLDVLIALAVTTFVLLACVSLLVSAAGAADAARQNTIAYNAARQVVENVRQYKGAPLAEGDYADLSAFGPVPQLDQASEGGMKDAAARMSVRMYRNPVKLLTVTVTWRSGDRGGTPRSRTLTTLISPNGVAP